MTNPLDSLKTSNPAGIRISVASDRITSDKTRSDGIRIVKFFGRKYSNGYSAHNGFSHVDSWAAWNGKEWFYGGRRKDALESLGRE